MQIRVRRTAAFIVLSLFLFARPGATLLASDRVASLQNALAEAGWDVERRSDGSIELRVTGSSEGPGEEGPESPDPTHGEAAMAEENEAVWDLLRDSGWRVERAVDESTLLYPPDQAQGPGESADIGSGLPAERPGKGLGDYLEERGWRVERANDGSLLLYPLHDDGGLAELAPPQPCPGVVPEVVREGKVALPVDRWDEANAIAHSWLGSVASPGSVVGRIRRIFRVFLVSIVAEKPPHGLQHQIAIDAGDGRVVVLN